MTTAASVTAIDGRPASPAMARALASIDATAKAMCARKERIANDPRIIRLRSLAPVTVYGYGVAGAGQVFDEMASGKSARRARIAALVRARTGQLDRNIHAVRDNLRDAAFIRRGNHWTRGEALTAPVVAGARNLLEAV